MGHPVSACHQWSTTGRQVEHAARPRVGVRIQALAGDEQCVERGDVVPVEQGCLGVHLPDRPHGRGCGEQHAHRVFGDDPPERPRIGCAHRFALAMPETPLPANALAEVAGVTGTPSVFAFARMAKARG